MSNVNDTFFDGHYKEIWKTLIPDELTVKEIDFMVPHFGLQPGSKVLDLMCGYGRHAIALAKKGIEVTAVDNLGDYINEIKATAAEDGLPLTASQHDVISYVINDQFDLSICMGNSLNFFNAADTVKLLANIAAHLKPGGHLLINSWSIAEIVFSKPVSNSWSKIGEYKFLTELKLYFQPTRMEVDSTMIAPDGTEEIKKGIDYVYSLNEMEAMLQQAGLKLKEVYSIPGRKKFSVGEPRAYLIAEKYQ
ncbi:MAG: class I SAM-dependent methyltransferase [Chitinophagaceae bacterium]|nr:class I SAM-dependent methyltransferase [Chitinophagaceae bacterium]